jgi:hypothetical protein
VYGGLDGIVTSFAVVAGVIGADMNANIVLVLVRSVAITWQPFWAFFKLSQCK